MTFKNPANGYVEESSSIGLWALIFGSFYFAVKGAWGQAVLSAVLALCTFGLSWLIYPFFASGIIRKHYLRKGWIELSE